MTSLLAWEARVRAFVKSIRTQYVLGMGTYWVCLGTYSTKKNFWKKNWRQLGTARVQLGTAWVRI